MNSEKISANCAKASDHIDKWSLQHAAPEAPLGQWLPWDLNSRHCIHSMTLFVLFETGPSVWVLREQPGGCVTQAAPQVLHLWKRVGIVLFSINHKNWDRYRMKAEWKIVFIWAEAPELHTCWKCRGSQIAKQHPRVLPGRGTEKVFVLGPPWYKG